MVSETLIALQKLKVDCLFTRSNHFNASRRLNQSSTSFRRLLVVGTIFATFSTIMNVGVWDKIQGDNTLIQVIVNVLGALGGFLLLYSTTFSDYYQKMETALKHENVGVELNLIFKQIRNTEAYFKDQLIDNEQLRNKLEELTELYISKTTSAPITNDKDYQKTKSNFEKGATAEYTEKELNV
jgi:hypothetical protein